MSFCCELGVSRVASDACPCLFSYEQRFVSFRRD
jgi:hypothetical protein